MIRKLSILYLIALCHLGLHAKPFHVYSPSSKENTLWIVKATPKGESLKLEVAEKVKFDFSGRVITAHPSKPLLYVTATGGDPGKVPGAVVFLNKDGSYQKHQNINFNDGACYLSLDKEKQAHSGSELWKWTAQCLSTRRSGHPRESRNHNR